MHTTDSKSRIPSTHRVLQQENLARQILWHLQIRKVFPLSATCKLWNSLLQNCNSHPERIGLEIPWAINFGFEDCDISLDNIPRSKVLTLAPMVDTISYFSDPNTPLLFQSDDFPNVKNMVIYQEMETVCKSFLESFFPTIGALHIEVDPLNP